MKVLVFSSISVTDLNTFLMLALLLGCSSSFGGPMTEYPSGHAHTQKENVFNDQTAYTAAG